MLVRLITHNTCRQNVLFHGSSTPFFKVLGLSRPSLRCLASLCALFLAPPIAVVGRQQRQTHHSLRAGSTCPFHPTPFPHPQHLQACAPSSLGSRGWREEGRAERRACQQGGMFFGPLRLTRRHHQSICLLLHPPQGLAGRGRQAGPARQ